MKTVFKSLVLIAAAAIALNSCSKNDAINSVKPEDMVTLKFRINNADEPAVSKALLGTENGKNFLNWEDGDKIGTFSVGGPFASGQSATNESKNNPGTVEVSGGSYTLNVQTFSAGAITNIYSYYPYSAAAGKEKTAAIVTIPESQTMNALGFDADAMPMAGEPVTVDISTASGNTDTPCGDINFANLGAIIQFNVYSSEATEETITSVKYIGEGIGGEFTIDLTSVDLSSANYENTLALAPVENGTVGEIITSYTTHPAIPIGKANAIPVYMVVAPGTYSNTQVVVTTNLFTYTLDASNAKTFARSHVKPMNVNIQSGTKGALPVEETWTKVTSASDFTEGTYYILRSDGAYYVPNGTGNPSCSSYSGGAITNGMKWTATASGDGLIFESYSNAGYYLWTTNTGSANTISVAQSSNGQNASNVWSFASVSANNTTYYTATAGANKYLVSYGTSNWRYYASGSISNSNLPAEFYKRSVVDSRPAPGMSWSAESVTATYNTGNSLSFTAPTLTAGNATGITYSSSDETIATISDAGVVSVNLTDNVVKEGSTTISAIYTATENGLYKSQTVSYTLTVADNRAAATTPTFDPAAGEVSANQVVTFQPTNESLTFHYTTNGSDPTIESPTAASVTIDAAKTVKVLATKTGYKPSAIATAAYTIQGVTITISTILADANIATSTVNYTVNGVTVMAAQGSKNYVIGDATGVMLMYYNSALTVGNQYNITGDVKLYNGVYEFSNPTSVTAGTGTAPAYGTPEAMTVSSLTSYASSPVTKYAVVQMTAPASGFVGSDGTNSINVYDGTGTWANYYGKVINVTGYLIGYYNSKINMIATAIEEDTTTPTISVSPSSLSWAAAETDSKTLTVTLNGAAAAGDYGYSVTSGTAGDWNIFDNGSGTITVSPKAANSSTSDAKSITIRIAHADDSTVYQDVTCTQSKANSGSTKEYTLTINASDFNTTSYAANNNEKTSNAVASDNSTFEVKWTSNQVMKNGTNMQWQKNNGYIYNSTDLGTIKSVTVNSSAGSFTKYYGTAEHPTSGTTVGNGFFTVKVGNATGTTSSVVIVFEN